MIWSELRGALRGRGLIRADETVGDGVVTGIAFDSRRVERGNVFVALQGLDADGAASARLGRDKCCPAATKRIRAKTSTIAPDDE